MKVEKFVELLNVDFWVGVPDSLLSPLCNYIMDTYGINPLHHIIAANEGNCVGIAAGYHLATKKIPVVYMQNSGQGNVINPIASLLNEKVYGIPMIFVIGWRGKPGEKDEPQHIFQGEITKSLLEVLEIESFVISSLTEEKELSAVIEEYNIKLAQGKSVAFVIEKNALVYDSKVKYRNSYSLVREDVIKHIVDVSKEDPVISTTGKISRELFEIREFNKQEHKYDFLTVGSMGHSSSIALGVAIQKKSLKVWCIDGDGAALMHLGAMTVIGANKPQNMIHIVINNEAHETVGGLPTVSDRIDLCGIATACGYQHVVCVEDLETLDRELAQAKEREGLYFIEVRCALGSRTDLGRPTKTAKENKDAFVEYIAVDVK